MDTTQPGNSSQEATQSASARRLLVGWANQQDNWVRAIVGEVITTRRELPPSSIEAARNLYLAEKKLSDDHAQEVPALGEDVGDASVGDALQLTGLQECRGVNALVEDQRVVFNPRMTVLFGENATGKTGYVRVLKRLANVRSAQPIIGNIYRPTAGTRPQARIEYKIGDEQRELVWQDEQGVPPFTRMTVFDNPEAALHLEDDITYLYTPADIALFKYVHEAIEQVRALVDVDLVAREPRTNPFVTAFSRGTNVFTRIETLGASTNLSELEELATVSDEDTSALEGLRASVQVLEEGSDRGRVQVLRGRATVLGNLATVCRYLRGFDVPAYDGSVSALSRARTEQSDAAAAVFRGEQLPEELRSAWQDFLDAGEQFLQARGQTQYPGVDDACIYCRQVLDDSARQLLSGYRAYSRGAAAEAVEKAESELRGYQAPLTSTEFTQSLEAVRGTVDDFEGDERPYAWADGVRPFLDSVGPVLNAVATAATMEKGEAFGLAATLTPQLERTLEEVRSALAAAQGSAEERAKLLAESQAQMNDLDARIRLSTLMPDIRQHVEQAQWADRLKTLLGSFQRLLRGVTDTSKAASEALLNRNFEQAFQRECERLRAPTVTLDFPGRRGEAARRKSVSPNHSIGEILSEGEQKVIAIADFLAEASLRGSSAPIVFDDPVTSFDQRRIGHIASRMAELANEHQVIVFTHNILLVDALFNEFENDAQNCAYYQLDEHDGRKGYVSSSIHPRLDTPGNLRARINSAIQEAQGAHDGDRQARVEAAYDVIRAWCESVIERELLAEVTRRYRSNVAVQNVERIRVDRLDAAFKAIVPIWERACSYIQAHAQAVETLGVRPTLDGLRSDWEALQAARSDYRAGSAT